MEVWFRLSVSDMDIVFQWYCYAHFDFTRFIYSSLALCLNEGASPAGVMLKRGK